MNRRNQLMAGILALQLIVVAVVLWPRPATSGGESEALFPGLEADQITKLTVTGTEGQQIQLARQADGWVLPEADDYPCQADIVAPLLTKIAGLKADRLVTQTSSSHKRLKVAEDDFERRVQFELDDGTGHVLYVGTSPTYGVAHVRAGDQDQVYLASDWSAQDAGFEATAYVDRTYFSVPQDEVVAFTVENASGRFDFQRPVEPAGGGGQWMLTDLTPSETLSNATVNTLFGRAASMSMLQPLGKEEKVAYGMGEPSAVVTIRTHSDETPDKTYTLRVGAKDAGDNTYVVISSESPYYVRVNEFAVKDFVEKTRDDLLELPPTPVPTPTPEATPEGL